MVSSLQFLTKIFYAFRISPMYVILLNLVILTIFGEDYKLWNSS
jgi:hypothetical protein